MRNIHPRIFTLTGIFQTDINFTRFDIRQYDIISYLDSLNSADKDYVYVAIDKSGRVYLYDIIPEIQDYNCEWDRRRDTLPRGVHSVSVEDFGICDIEWDHPDEWMTCMGIISVDSIRKQVNDFYESCKAD